MMLNWPASPQESASNQPTSDQRRVRRRPGYDPSKRARPDTVNGCVLVPKSAFTTR